MNKPTHGFAFVAALLLSQHCILPEVEPTPNSAISEMPAQALAADPGNAHTPTAANNAAVTHDAGRAQGQLESSGAPAVPPQGSARDLTDASTPITPEMEAKAGMMAPAQPGGLDAACTRAADCQTRLICHESSCKRDRDEACAVDQECALGSCYGVCQPPVEGGGACDSQGDCVTPAFCKMNRCLYGIGRKCLHNYQCTTGSCFESQCTELGSRLRECTSDANCETGLVCITLRSGSDSGTTSPFCEEVGSFPIDAPCRANSDCRDRSCQEGYCASP